MLADESGELGACLADPNSAARPGAKTATGGVAAADDQIDRLLLKNFEHARKQRLVVLKVGVHGSHIGRRACQHALDAGARQSASSDPLDASNTRIDARERPDVPG